jgi:hypothetical protein
MHNILALVGKANKLLELTTLQGDAKRDSPPISVNKSFVVAPCSNPKEARSKEEKKRTIVLLVVDLIVKF